MNDRKPRDIAPLTYEASTRKNWKVREALNNDAWVSRICILDSFSLNHLCQFVTLWTTLRGFHLDADAKDDIVWKHTASGQYTAESAYKAQFLGTIKSPM